MRTSVFQMYCMCRLGEAFIKPAFYEPLVQHKDPLSGLHANTHLAQECPACACLMCAAGFLCDCLHLQYRRRLH